MIFYSVGNNENHGFTDVAALDCMVLQAVYLSFYKFHTHSHTIEGKIMFKFSKWSLPKHSSVSWRLPVT